ncbi:MAG: hypothetical protein ACLQDL_13070 [Spirochaetia bacterium]
MKRHRGEPGLRFLFWRIDFVGVAMVVTGAFFLLVNFKIIPASDFVVPRVLGILFTMAGLIFLFFSGAGRWLSWFVIPAGALLTLGIVTLVFGWNRFFSTDSASLFSLGFGLTFLTLFYFRRGNWWVLIPSGVFIGLSFWVEMLSHFSVTGWHPVAPLLFLGISFIVIWLYSVQKQRMKWSLLVGALIVGASLLYLLGILLARWSLLWPVILLLAGLLVPLWLMASGRRSRRHE